MLEFGLIIHHPTSDRVKRERRVSNDRESGVLALPSGDESPRFLWMLCQMCCARCACPARFSSTCTRMRAVGARRRRSGKTVVDAMFPGSDHLICYHLLMKAVAGRRSKARSRSNYPPATSSCCRRAIRTCWPPSSAMRKTPEMSMYRMPDDGQLPVHDFGRHATAATPAHFVCGFLGCDSRPYNPLLTALPRVIDIKDHASGALGAYFRAALAESKGRMGGAIDARPHQRAHVRRRHPALSRIAARRTAPTGCRGCAIHTSAAH